MLEELNKEQYKAATCNDRITVLCVICLDNDDAGNEGTIRLKKALLGSTMVRTMTMPDGKDLSDLTYEEFLQCYNNRE